MTTEQDREPADWAHRCPWQDGPERETLIRERFAGVPMERDDDLIRSLMLELTSHGDYQYQFLPDTDAEGDELAAQRRKYYHLRLLADAGFLQETGRFGGTFRVTWSGQEFARMAKSETFWADIKRAVGHQAKTRGVEFLFETGLELMRGLIRGGGL